MGFSLIPLIDAVIRRSFLSAGLRPHTISIDTETTIHCWHSESDPADSTKPPLLLLHGFGPRSTWQWWSQVGPLSRHFSLIIPDLIFFGGSHSSSPLRSESFQAESLARLLEILGLAGQRVSVVGTSYGGFVAYHLARFLGEERVDRVVVASSDLLKAEADDLALLRRGGAESIPELLLPSDAGKMRAVLKLVMYRPPRFIPDFVLRDFIRNLFSDNLEEKTELIKGSTIGKEGFDLTPLPQEVLIIWGEHDEIFPIEKAFEVKRCLGEKAKLEIIKKTGHIPQAEDPNRFNEILLNFLLSK